LPFFTRLRFRQKVILLLLVISVASLTSLIPFTRHSVRRVARESLLERVTDLIDLIQPAPNEEQLGYNLREQKHLVFSRSAIIKSDRTVLYDTKAKKILKSQFDPDVVVLHPEVEQAFETGSGYNEDYSVLLQQKLVYVARSFEFQGKEYVLRAAFPYDLVGQLMSRFEIGLMVIASLLILVFIAVTYGVIFYLTEPIQIIINAIRPYQEGRQNLIPRIVLPRSHPDDEFSRLAGTLNRLSERIRNQISTLTHERNEKSSLLEALNEGVIAVTENLTVAYANRIAKKLLNVVEGSPFSQEESCERLLRMAQESQETLTDHLLLESQGRTYLEIVAIPMPEKGAVLVLQDLSSHYQALQMTKDFVSNASHELKTPITIIRGFAEMLRDHPELPEEKVGEITRKIVKNSNRMNTLIGDLLRLAEIENVANRDLEPCDLLQILEGCKQMVLDVYPDAKVTIGSEEGEPFVLKGNRGLLEQAFQNLMSNGAKYSDAPASIDVYLRRSAKRVVVSISDHGIGIPKEDLPHIFTRFFTVDKAHSKEVGGTGLGLAIVETVVQKMGGTIDVTSTFGEGTTFTLTLPDQSY